jgi:riboflavin transporter 2
LNLNGIWIELPLLIPRLPERWALSPDLGLASNIANIGPLIIALIRYLIGESSAYEVPSICVIFSVGIIVPLILSFTWFKPVYLFGQNRSLYLLILGFFLALVNCTSSVTYLPFVNRFDHKWLNIYFAGESLSSLIPAMLGLLQVN